MIDARELLAATATALPERDRGALTVGEASVHVPYNAVRDRGWLEEQVRLFSRRWGTEDRRVLATLWWYSASIWSQTPSVASLVATGRALSPHLDDITVHHRPDGRVTGATSAVVLPGDDPDTSARSFATALREVLEEVVPLVARVGRMPGRALWAVASDSTANRFLWAGRALGQVGRATALAETVVAAVGRPLPRLRWVDVPAVDALGRDRPDLPAPRFIRRSSCCLLLAVPGEDMCGSCPRRPPAERWLRLRHAASVQALEP